jgi:hypothetical protein
MKNKNFQDIIVIMVEDIMVLVLCLIILLDFSVLHVDHGDLGLLDLEMIHFLVMTDANLEMEISV